MRPLRTFLLLVTSIMCSACASSATSGDIDTSLVQVEPKLKRVQLHSARSAPAPAWVYAVPRSPNDIYVVGEAREIEQREDALERAWVSGLLRIGMTHFPELGALKSESVETLRDANYKRQFILALDKINWAGLREVEERGSPFIKEDPETGKFTVYRLLRWSKSDVETSRTAARKLKARHELPVRPELARQQEEEMISEVQKMRATNQKIINRDSFVAKVLREARCNLTLYDLVGILGGPDREGPYNGSSIHEKYYWGTYEVMKYKDEPNVYQITSKNGGGNSRTLCSN